MSIEKGRHLAIATIDADPGEADTSFSSELDHFLSQSKQIVKQEAMKQAGLVAEYEKANGEKWTPSS